MAFRRTTRPPRKLPPHKGYAPTGEPEGYQPPLRTRKAPRAYWRRNPYPVGFADKLTGVPQQFPEKPEPEYDEEWDPMEFFGMYGEYGPPRQR